MLSNNAGMYVSLCSLLWGGGGVWWGERGVRWGEGGCGGVRKGCGGGISIH